jgi:hypothetical protein
MSSAPGRPTPGNPGFARQDTVRTWFRVLGIVLLVGGIAVSITGFARFALMGGEDSFPGQGEILVNMAMFMGGGIVAGVGGTMVKAGFIGLAARYGAGELSPVAKDTAAYLSDGEGVLGVGRTVDDRAPATAGRFCGSCGAARGNDRFCAGCGAPTA